MQLSNAPGKLVLPFANAGAKNTIPAASQIGITAGAASLTDGFPPLTRTPIAAGGVPPSGLDMNGILYALSAALRWANAGGGYVYDSTFAADSNVGGYPKGARVLRSDGAGYWLNTIDGNTVDPESVAVNQAQIAGWVPDLTNGVAAVTMTSENVTLTPLQYGKPIIVLSGTLTANLNLIFPNLVGEWTVVNNCTGNFSVTAKTAAGTGITIASGGRRRILWGDGDNLYNATDSADTPAQFNSSTLLATTAFIRATGAAFGGVKSVSGAATLDATYAGQLTVFTGTAYTATLPAASTYPAGTTLTFYSATSGNVAVTRAGSDVISVNNASSVTALNLGSGDTLTLVSDGSSVWDAVAGSAQLGYSSQFLSSKGASGYQKLPGGLIIQWMTVRVTTNGISATFPIAFPNACFHVFATESDGGLLNFGAAPLSNSQGTVWCNSTSGVARLLIIGY